MGTSRSQKREAAYSRETVKKQLNEAIGDDDIVYDLDGEHQYVIPHPFFYPQDLKDRLEPLADDDEEGIAKALLGDQWDDFVAAGGTATDVIQLNIAVQMDTTATLRSGRPTRR